MTGAFAVLDPVWMVSGIPASEKARPSLGRLLRTPREVRRVLAYVLLNARRHWAKRHAAARRLAAMLDPASSGRWFDGWRPAASRLPEARGDPEVSRPRTWLLRTGWRRHGLVDPTEAPGVAA